MARAVWLKRTPLVAPAAEPFWGGFDELRPLAVRIVQQREVAERLGRQRELGVGEQVGAADGDHDRRPGKSSKEIREAVSDRGGAVRSGGEAAHKGGATAKEPRS
jgi:hypothetical protein